eukprot:4949235-Pyramimonas_sp.AAC.2
MVTVQTHETETSTDELRRMYAPDSGAIACIPTNYQLATLGEQESVSRVRLVGCAQLCGWAGAGGKKNRVG